MAINRLIENDQIIADLRGALRDGQSGLRYVPKLLRRVLKDDAWRRRIDSATRAEVGFNTFAEFVTTAPTEGLGADMALIERIVGTGDADLLRMLREAKKVGPGRRTDLEPTIDSIGGSLNSGRADAAVERLAREAPDEYASVQRGEKSINAAAVSAGIRKHRISVRLDNAESAAETLRKHMAPEELARLRQLLD